MMMTEDGVFIFLLKDLNLIRRNFQCRFSSVLISAKMIYMFEWVHFSALTPIDINFYFFKKTQPKPLHTKFHILVLFCHINRRLDLDMPKNLPYSLSKWPSHQNRKSRHFISSCLTQLCHHQPLVNNSRQVKC